MVSTIAQIPVYAYHLRIFNLVEGEVVQVYFDVQQLYYIPQYTPIQAQLENAGVDCTYVFYLDENLESQQKKVAEKLGCEVKWVKSEPEARQLYLASKPDWLLIGNYFSDLELIHQHTKTGLLSHGIGPKACYYSVSDSMPTVRFVEGPYRTKRLTELYPDSKFVDTGYAKLDPLINKANTFPGIENYGLDPNKKTILYAPTFYPSSIECIPKKFPEEFSDYNIIVKPHYFSLANDKYRKQKNRLNHWANYKNVYLSSIDDVNILPFMGLADVLISDASSTLFEFAALNKPVVWCDFYKLRLGYRGIFKYRFEKRMDKDLYKYADIAVHAEGYKDLKKCVDSQIVNPDEKSKIRLQHTLALAGIVDGEVSNRISSYIVSSGGHI